MDYVIAIDGPAASGKSTVARGVAEALGYFYVDSGALYRGMTWVALRKKVPVTDAKTLVSAIQGVKMDFFVDGNAVKFGIDGIKLGCELRTDEINENVGAVSAVPEVRAMVVDRLRSLTRYGNLVVEGRDIGTAVFPDARHKFYLDADPSERARRRHAELVGGCDEVSGRTVESVKASLMRRDKVDSGRKTAPLKVASDAFVINSTYMLAEQVIGGIVQRIKERQTHTGF